MVDFLVVNSTNAELTNVNAGGVDVPARTVGDTITLTAAELLVLAAIPGVAVMATASTRQQMRNCGRRLKYGKVQTL